MSEDRATYIAAVTPHPDAMSAGLMQPFPREAIKQRRGGGGRSLDYIEGHTVIRRLIHATGNEFDIDVLDLTWRDDLLLATVQLTIPGLGRRQHIGVQKVSAGGGEDLVKGAVTDAIKKAATLFGVGLELYGPDYDADDDAQHSQPHRGGAPSRPVARERTSLPSQDRPRQPRAPQSPPVPTAPAPDSPAGAGAPHQAALTPEGKRERTVPELLLIVHDHDRPPVRRLNAAKLALTKASGPEDVEAVYQDVRTHFPGTADLAALETIYRREKGVAEQAEAARIRQRDGVTAAQAAS